MLLNLDKSALDNAPEWSGGGFPLPKQGMQIPFEILGDDDSPAMLDAKENDDGVVHEDFVVRLATVGDDDQEIKHGEFFRLDEDWGLGKWKAFLSALHGRKLNGTEVAGFDTDSLIGIRFTCDVSHQTGKKNGKVFANLDYKTLEPEGGFLETAPANEKPKPSKPARPGSRR